MTRSNRRATYHNEERFSLGGATHGTLREGSAAGDRAGKRKTLFVIETADVT